VEGGRAQVVADNSTPAQSPGWDILAFSIHVRSKTMLPSKLGGNDAQNNAPGTEVRPNEWSFFPTIPEPYNPTILLIFNVHDSLLDTSLLTQPNPNPNIRVTKKTKTPRFVF
jgi:hypothetical protein